MEVLQNEWTAYCLVKITPYHRALDIKRTAGERDVRIRGSTLQPLPASALHLKLMGGNIWGEF